MFKVSLQVLVFLSWAVTGHAQSYRKDIGGLCSVLVHKDITSVYTRDTIKRFFFTDDDLSNFIVYMDVEMKRAGFTSFVVEGCRIRSVSSSDAHVQAVFDITGKGELFFLKKHAMVRTRWTNRDGRWYLEPPSVIPSGD